MTSRWRRMKRLLPPCLFIVFVVLAPTAGLADPDGGFTESYLRSVGSKHAEVGVDIWAACPEPPAGDVAEQLDGGSVLLSPARAAFDACRIAAGESCSGQLTAFPALYSTPDAGFTWQTSHTVATVAGVVSALLSIYITDRQARHLPLWP